MQIAGRLDLDERRLLQSEEGLWEVPVGSS